MKNSADLGGCYPPRPSASVDNTLLDLQNSSYPTQSHSIIANYLVGSMLSIHPSIHPFYQSSHFHLLKRRFLKNKLQKSNKMFLRPNVFGSQRREQCAKREPGDNGYCLSFSVDLATATDSTRWRPSAMQKMS